MGSTELLWVVCTSFRRPGVYRQHCHLGWGPRHCRTMSSLYCAILPSSLGSVPAGAEGSGTFRQSTWSRPLSRIFSYPYRFDRGLCTLHSLGGPQPHHQIGAMRPHHRQWEAQSDSKDGPNQSQLVELLPSAAGTDTGPSSTTGGKHQWWPKVKVEAQACWLEQAKEPNKRDHLTCLCCIPKLAWDGMLGCSLEWHCHLHWRWGHCWQHVR